MLSPGPGGSELEDHRIQPRVGPHRRRIPQEPPFLSRHSLSSLYQILQPKRESTETATRTGALLVPDANLPSGGKEDKQKGAAKAGGGYKSRANAALARSGGKYPEKFRNMGWMEEPEGIE